MQRSPSQPVVNHGPDHAPGSSRRLGRLIQPADPDTTMKKISQFITSALHQRSVLWVTVVQLFATVETLRRRFLGRQTSARSDFEVLEEGQRIEVSCLVGDARNIPKMDMVGHTDVFVKVNRSRRPTALQVIQYLIAMRRSRIAASLLCSA